jgi:hypothetical protein
VQSPAFSNQQGVTSAGRLEDHMEPRRSAIDNTAERSFKIWQECGERLQQQYRDGLMPPPPRPLRMIEKVPVLKNGGHHRWDDNFDAR